MRRALLLLAFAGAARGEEEPRRAFVEVTAPRAAYFAGEAVPLRLRFGFDRDYFRTNAVPLFRRELDLPLHIEAPWLRGLPGGSPLPADGGGEEGERIRFALNDEAVFGSRAADTTVGGRAFTVVERTMRFRFEKPGLLEVAAPLLRFAHASRVEEDLLGNRIAEGRREETVAGAPLPLRIDPLPEEGRPAGFRGAVGRFSVFASADRTALGPGESLRFTLRIEGEGNLDLLDAPPLEGFGRFHNFGVALSRGKGTLTAVYDVRPLGPDAAEVPSVAFPHFDPGPPAQYRIARTAPIPLDLRRIPGPAVPATTPPESALFRILLRVVAAVALVAAVVWGRRRRAAAAAPPAPPILDPAADPALALTDFLALRLRCPPSAVAGPDLAARLEATGVPPPLAALAASTHARLIRARYGGEPFPEGPGEAASVAGAIVAATTAPGRGARRARD